MIDAGELRERIEVLTYTRTAEGWAWETTRQSWAKATLSTRRNNYSTRALGAPGVTFVMRRQALDLGSAILWRGQHCLLTAIIPMGPNHLTVEAALVDLTACRDEATGERFQAVAQEKYVRYGEGDPMDTDLTRLVLTVPKAVKLDPGQLVELRGGLWPVRTAHELDIWKNEYEIERTAEL